MGMSGIEMMLKAAGIDPQKIVADFTTLKDAVIQTLAEVNETNKKIFSAIDRMEQRQSAESESLKSIGTYLVVIQERQEEIWQKMEMALRMSSQIQLVQPPPVPNPLPPPLESQPTLPMSQPQE